MEGAKRSFVDSGVEDFAVEVMLESITTIRAVEAALGSFDAESAVSSPSVGPSLEDVEADGRRKSFEKLDSLAELVVEVFGGEGKRREETVKARKQ